MFAGVRIGRFRAFGVSAAVAGLLAGAALVGPTTAGAAVATKSQTPAQWTEKFCTGLVQWEAAALDARDATFPIVRTAPTDRPGVKTAVVALDTALKPPAKAIDAVAANLGRRTPSGKNGAVVGRALATDVGELADAYATARQRATALKSAWALIPIPKPWFATTRLPAPGSPMTL